MKKRFMLACAAACLISGCASESSSVSTDTTAVESIIASSAETIESTSAESQSASETAIAETTTESIIDETAISDDTDEEKKPKVKFSVDGGVYLEEVTLALTAPEGYKIYYTTDGSDPRISGTRTEYTEELQLKKLDDAKNVVAAVDPDLFDTAHCKYDRSTQKLVCQLKAPSDSAVDKCNVIKAVCVNDEGEYSKLTSNTYFIGAIEDHIDNLAKAVEAAGSSLAVISLTANFDDFFDYEKGIYVRGASFDKSWEGVLERHEANDEAGRKILANYSQRGKDWEREIYMDFYEYTTDSAVNTISQSCGIRIQGNYSRSDLQKGFRLYARNDYGKKRFKASVFGDSLKSEAGEVIDSFKTLVLRNGGNCAFTTKFSDTFWQSLIGDLDVSVKKSRPAVVYLNGEYWGIYVLEEDFSTEYFADHYGVESNDVVLYKGDAETYESGYKLDLGDIPDGEKEDYYLKELNAFFSSHSDCSSKDDFDALANIIDVESFRDYFAVETWINNKWDWPGKNWSMWKTITDTGEGYADGKWRMCIYDVEFGGVSGEWDANVNTIREDNYKPQGLLDFDTKNPTVLCFAYLMTNADFRQDFYNSLNALSENQFSYETADKRLKEFEDVYGALLGQFYKRFPGTGSVNDALNGGYASSKCIRDFLKKRPKYIQPMIDYCEKVRGDK